MSNGILSTFKKDGSDLSAYDGRTPPTIIFATQQSPMLAPYSIGGPENGAIAAYQTYNDGANNLIHRPTQLSMGAKTPPQYLNNLPQ